MEVELKKLRNQEANTNSSNLSSKNQPDTTIIKFLDNKDSKLSNFGKEIIKNLILYKYDRKLKLKNKNEGVEIFKALLEKYDDVKNEIPENFAASLVSFASHTTWVIKTGMPTQLKNLLSGVDNSGNELNYEVRIKIKEAIVECKKENSEVEKFLSDEKVEPIEIKTLFDVKVKSTQKTACIHNSVVNLITPESLFLDKQLKQIEIAAKFICDTKELKIINYLIGKDIQGNVTFTQMNTPSERKTKLDELSSLILNYFIINTKYKNELLAKVQTSNIQKTEGHDKIFMKLFNMNFADFIIFINSNIEKEYLEKSLTKKVEISNGLYTLKAKITNPKDVIKFVSPDNRIAGIHSNIGSRSGSISYEPDFIWEKEVIELVFDNSRVSFSQVYNTKSTNFSLNIKGYKTNSSANKELKKDDFNTNAVGINHNLLTFNFSNNTDEYTTEIHTAGSYKSSEDNYKNDAMQLLQYFKNDSKNIIDLRFLKSFGGDQNTYTQHQTLMKEVVEKEDMGYNILWLNSCGMATEYVTLIKEPEVNVNQIIYILCTDSKYIADTNLQKHIEHAKKLLEKLLTSKKYDNLNNSRTIFALILIITSVMPKEKQPNLFCGCMSAKDRTMSFVASASIISALFFHRVYGGKKYTEEGLFAFLDLNRGSLVEDELDEEELNLVKAMLNNPVLFNVLSKCGTGQYNNKNLYIVNDLIKHCPSLQNISIEKSLINCKA